MKLSYTFVSAGCWGENTYNVHEVVIASASQRGERPVGSCSTYPGIRLPEQFLEWWTGTQEFDHVGYSYETEEYILRAFRRWIHQTLFPRISEGKREVLDKLVHEHYAKCAANVNNTGTYGQVEYLLLNGTTPETILKAHGVTEEPT